MNSQEDYLFFFSYASKNYENANWSKFGKHGNHLKQFYSDLCKHVSDLCGKDAEKVGYWDKKRINISDFWGSNLISGLQNSKVLVSIISSHYLDSEGCGREFEFFNKRYDLFKSNISNSTEMEKTHRIIPVFWRDKVSCYNSVDSNIIEEINPLQFTDNEMPDQYPRTQGVRELCRLSKQDEYEDLCSRIAHRIVDLFRLDPLPKLTGTEDFSELHSAFHRKKEKKYFSANGPDGTNVFYVVGTKNEIKEKGKETKGYDDNPEKWCPFLDAPGVTIDLATQEGNNLAGQKDFLMHDLPEKLLPMIEEAKEQSSPVLLVLDQHSLMIPRFEKIMREYDEKNFGHVGLVSADGQKGQLENLEKVFPYKFGNKFNHHVWDVPTGKFPYVNSVKETLTSLKQYIRKTGKTNDSSPGSKLPGLAGPK